MKNLKLLIISLGLVATLALHGAESGMTLEEARQLWDIPFDVERVVTATLAVSYTHLTLPTIYSV